MRIVIDVEEELLGEIRELVNALSNQKVSTEDAVGRTLAVGLTANRNMDKSNKKAIAEWYEKNRPKRVEPPLRNPKFDFNNW